MATLNTVKKQLARLGIRATVPALRSLISNYRDSPNGWTITFDGAGVLGRMADQGATRATFARRKSSFDRHVVHIAVIRDHSWQKPETKRALEDIDRQLDDLLEESGTGTGETGDPR